MLLLLENEGKHYYDPMNKKYWCVFGGVIGVICTYISKKDYEAEREKNRAVKGNVDQKCDESSKPNES